MLHCKDRAKPPASASTAATGSARTPCWTPSYSGADPASIVRRYGAAVVVMAFDEQGQADTVEPGRIIILG